MAMLALLAESPQHGFALKQRYDDLLGQDRELKAGQVYSTLARLERDGYCEGLGFEKGSAADKRIYAITDSGVMTVHEWITTPALPSGRPGEVFSKVVLALVAGADGAAVLDAHRNLYLTRMRELVALRRNADDVDRLAADYEIEHLQADLNWIETASARLDSLNAVRTDGATS